jgi:hypothetical protein
MPSHPEQDGDQNLNILQGAWDQTLQHWRDDTTRRFDTHHWSPLQNESRSYLAALHRLMDLLKAAERDTEY